MQIKRWVPPEFADRFICRQAGTVLFSADSGGDDRFPLNPKPPQYWIEKFEKSGFRFDELVSSKLKQDWEARQTAPWFYRYPMVFRHSS